MPALGVSDTSRSFAVVVHDVAPAFLPQLARIAEALAPRIGRRLAGAVVPCWHGRPIEGPDGQAMFVTVHPSFLLRVPDEAAKAREYRAFVADLRAIGELVGAPVRVAGG